MTLLILEIFENFSNSQYSETAILQTVSERYDFWPQRCRFSEFQKTTQISIFYRQVRFSEPFLIVIRFREPNLPVEK
jgi:hypothetical protein